MQRQISTGRRRVAAVVLLVALLAMLPSARQGAPAHAAQTATSSTNLVINGSFEQPVVRSESGIITHYSGQTFDGWSVETGSVDLISRDYWEHADGNQSVDMSGEDAGVIYQDLATQSGASYQLAFSFAGNSYFGGIKQMEVWWGDTLLDTLTFNTAGHSFQHMGWERHSYSVTASASSTRLRFKSLNAGPCGPVLDAVSVLPQSLVLTANAGYTSIQLAWSAAADPHVTGYRLSRAVDAAEPAFETIATPSDPSYVDASGLAAGSTYCYQVTALRDDGQIAASSNIACARFGQIELWVPDTWGAPGTTVLVPVNVSNADGLCIAAADIWLDFDGAIIEPVAVTRSALTAAYAWDYAVQDTDTGKRIKIAAVSTSAPALRGAGSLFWITFHVRGAAGDTSPLNLREFIAGVGGSSIQDPSYVDIPLHLSSGVFTVGTAYSLGDLSGDGLVQAIDALMALDIASGKLIPTAAQQLAGDTNGDGTVSAADATMILFYITHRVWPTPETTLAMAPAPRAAASNMRISLDEVAALPGQTVALTLRGENLTDAAGGEFTIAYDRTLITGIDLVDTSGLAAGFYASAYDDEAGRLQIAVAGAHPIAGSGALATLRLHVAASAPPRAITPLTLANAQINDLLGRDFTASLGLMVERQSGVLRVQDNTIYLPVVAR